MRCPRGTAAPDQQHAATLTIAEAFGNDPLLEILAPDPARRVKLGPPMMGVLLAYGMRYGRVWANDDASTVSIWLHPEGGPMTMPRMLRAGMWRAPFMLGLDGMGRMSKAMSATERFHKQVEGPHWYLMTVGTRAARQGQGLGSTLVELGTSRADAAGVPCYLETGTDSNIVFYRKRGFEVVGQADCYGYTRAATTPTSRSVARPVGSRGRRVMRSSASVNEHRTWWQTCRRTTPSRRSTASAGQYTLSR